MILARVAHRNSPPGGGGQDRGRRVLPVVARAEGVGAGVVVAEPVGVAVEVEHDRAVQEAVEHGGGDGGVAEDLAPGADAAVGGQDDARFWCSAGR